MPLKRTTLLGTLAIGGLLIAPLVFGKDIDPSLESAARQVAIGTCASCHGPGGHSALPKFPVLAGQRANYLAAQLQAFKSKSRGDPDALGYMWGMAEPLSDDLIDALAAYYAAQAPRSGPAENPTLIARGKSLYENGDASLGVPPCMACHGPEGRGTDNFPRLAGQHAQYVLKQLRSFQSNMRDVAVMHGVAQSLRADDMEAVALYLQSAGP
jgi:cytochrome c553